MKSPNIVKSVLLLIIQVWLVHSARMCDKFAKRVAPTEIRVLRGRSRHHHTRHPVALTNRQTKISQDGECRHAQSVRRESRDRNMSERRYRERLFDDEHDRSERTQLETRTAAGCRTQLKG